VPRVLKLKQVAHELLSARGNDHAVRLRNALQARRKIRRLTYDGLLLGSAGADQVADDYEARSDADARLEGRLGLQGTYSSHQLQARSDSPFRIVLVRLRIPKVDEDTSPMYFATKPSRRPTVSATHF
jgi:hypothetical protein